MIAAKVRFILGVPYLLLDGLPLIVVLLGATIPGYGMIEAHTNFIGLKQIFLFFSLSALTELRTVCPGVVSILGVVFAIMIKVSGGDISILCHSFIFCFLQMNDSCGGVQLLMTGR